MSFLGTHKGKVVLAVVLLGALLAWFSLREHPDVPKRDNRAVPASNPEPRTSFDFYLLALTLHPAFCADGHQGKRECSAGGHRLLVIHGLWPERLQPRTYPHDCPA